MLQAPQDTNMIGAVWREPFKLGSPRMEYWPEGLSVAEMAARMPEIPAEFFNTGVIMINGQIVPRDRWHLVRPKPATVNHRVDVTLHMPLQDGDQGKGIFGLIAAIALTIATAGLASVGIPALGIAGGTIGAKLLAASVGIVGALVIGALTAPPVRRAQEQAQDTRTLEPASVEGNVLEANTAVPRVLGTRRVFPPFAFEPVIELIGQDEFVDALYCLAGPHRLENIRLGESSWDESTVETDLEIETREGLPGEAELDLTRRQGRTQDINADLSTHGTNPESQRQFEPPLPVWHGMATANEPDEAWMHLTVLGLIRQQDDTQSLRVPLRIRMRRRGDIEWRYLPEIHYMDDTQAQRRVQIKFMFGDAFEAGLPEPPITRGFIEARTFVPGQDVMPMGEDFLSDPYFSEGSGTHIYRSGTQETTSVRNITLLADLVTIYLDDAEWIPGVYEIEIIRGSAFRNDQFISDTYELQGGIFNSDIIDFFGSTADGQLPVTREGLLDRIRLVRLVSVRNQYPVNQGSLAMIAVKARNRSVAQLSVEASGWVNDFGIGYVLPTAPDDTIAPSTVYTTVFRTFDAAFECTVRLPAVPTDGVLWEAGGVIVGAALYLRDGGTVFQLRTGDGNSGVQESTADTAILNVLVSSIPQYFDGGLHKVAWDFSLDIGRARLWIDDFPIGEAQTIGGASLSEWTGVNDSGYLTESGNMAGVTSPYPDWPDISDAGNLDAFYQSRMDEGGLARSLITTSNPAPHFLDILTGPLNFDPLPEELIDFDSLVEWRQACIDNDYTCDMVAEGEGLAELLRIVASTGFARPYHSELWGVIRDYDRSGEAPVQLFSPRNMRSFSWRKAFARVPAGFRVTFRDVEIDYAATQLTVYRQGAPGTDARTEQVQYEGFVHRDKVINRAQFDLLQVQHRSTFYSFNAPAEALVCRRGSLIGVSHDILARHYGYARIESVIVNSGDEVTGVVLDSTIDVKNEPDMLEVADMLQVEDMLEVGLQTAIAIRRTDGTTTLHPISTAAGETDTLTFETPVPNDTTAGGPFDSGSIPEIDQGSLVVAGILGNEYKRLIVSEITNGRDLTAQITAVDEAPQLWVN